MRLVVTGGRTFKDRYFIFRALNSIHKFHGITALRHGDAEGADRICGEWAALNNVPVEVFPADWDNINVEGAKVRRFPTGKLYNANAGVDRNKRMASTAPIPDLAVIFPGGAGTMHMAKLLIRDATITVLELTYD